MKNNLRKSARNYILLMALIIPLGINGQSPLMVSGNGQLRMLPTADYMAGITYYNFLPQYKPRTKSVTFTRFNLYYSDNEGDFVRHNNGDCCRTTIILYDDHGRIVKLQYSNGSDSFLYEDDKIIEFQSKIDNEFAKVERTRFKYDLGGHLESATHKEWTYRYNLDNNGNFTSVISYYNAKERNSMNGFQYDGNHRMVAYHNDISDYLWNYDKEGFLVSYRKIGYSLSKGRKGGKDSDYEYHFEYNEDGNPIRCVQYKHGDITIIDGAYEYEYNYTFYPTQEELERQEAEEKARLRQLELEWRREDSIKRVAKYMPCKFLFDSEGAFLNCISKEINLAEKEITGLILKKIQQVSSQVISGKELKKEDNPVRTEIMQVCDMCIQLNSLKLQYDFEEQETITRIYNYTENALQSFVSGRNFLNRAYQKSQRKEYSVFLLSYINNR